jgi:hypothetical protein
MILVAASGRECTCHGMDFQGYPAMSVSYFREVKWYVELSKYIRAKPCVHFANIDSKRWFGDIVCGERQFASSRIPSDKERGFIFFRRVRIVL